VMDSPFLFFMAVGMEIVTEPDTSISIDTTGVQTFL
jgi:hypothetical protein